MREQIQGGEKQADPIVEYLERVGCPIEAMADKLLPNEAEAAFLSDYLTLRSKWRNDCVVAAGAEHQFVNLMGEHSYQFVPKDHSIFGDREKLAKRYGATLAGRQALDGFQAMQSAGHELAKDVIGKRPKELTSLQQYVWHSVLADDYPMNNANLDPVEFAYDAFEMLEEAVRHMDEPLLVVRTRKNQTSDIILATHSRLNYGEKSIDLVAGNGIRIVFEKEEHEHFGGHSGLIGGGHWEDVWRVINKDNLKDRIEKFDNLAVCEVVSPKVNGAQAKTRFAALSQLANSDEQSFEDHLTYRPKTSFSLSYTEPDPPTLAILTGEHISGVLSAIHGQEAPNNLRFREFYGALKAGIGFLFEQQKEDEHAALMEKVGELAVDPSEFYNLHQNS